MSQSDPNTSGFKPHRATQPKSFLQRTRCLMGQSSTISNKPLSEKVKPLCLEKGRFFLSSHPAAAVYKQQLSINNQSPREPGDRSFSQSV
jgi:hypothetical protein